MEVLQYAENAAAIGALAEMRTHMEHVINILEGTAGAFHGLHRGRRSPKSRRWFRGEALCS